MIGVYTFEFFKLIYVKSKFIKMKKLFYMIIFFGIFILNQVVAQDFKFSFVEKYKMDENPKLKIKTGDGFIDVYPSNTNNIEIFYIVKKIDHHLKKWQLISLNREELEKLVTLKVFYNNRNLEIEVRNNFDFNILHGVHYEVSFEVSVPKTTSCELKTSDGNLFLKGLKADQYCKTSDGNIEASNVQGELYAFTSDGKVYIEDIIGNTDVKTSDGNIEAKNITGDANFTTSDGDIDITNISGNVYAQTSDGNILVNHLKGILNARTSDGDIEGNISELNGTLKLQTSNGDIKAIIPNLLGFDLNLQGEHILTDLKNFDGKRSRNSIYGTINGGGNLIYLKTSDGRISLFSK